MAERIREFITGIRHPRRIIGSFVFFILYCIAFSLLERRTTGLHLIYCPFDAEIPFIPFFVIFYYSWFLYVFFTLVLFFFTSEEDYLTGYRFMAIGMAFFIIFNFFYPTVIDIRPDVVPGRDPFSALVRMMYSIDTPSDVFPSLHVYNTIAMHATIINSSHLRQRIALKSRSEKQYHKKIRAGYTASAVLSVLIILSTMFIKQHSVIDVLGAMLMGAVVYYFMFMFRKPSQQNG